MAVNGLIRSFSAGLVSLAVLMGPAHSAAMDAVPLTANGLTAQTSAPESVIFGPGVFNEIDHGTGISFAAAGFDLRATGEFPARMSDALARSAAASDARLIGLMPISPEFAPLGVGAGAMHAGGMFSTGFLADIPGAPRPELLIVLLAVAVASFMFLRRRRSRMPRHYLAYGA